MPIITTIKEIEKEFEEKFIDTGIDWWQTNMDYDRDVTPSLVKSFLTQSHKKVLEAVLEDSKRIQGDPFTDSEEFLDGMAMFKSKLITTLSEAIKTLEV